MFLQKRGAEHAAMENPLIWQRGEEEVATKASCTFCWKSKAQGGSSVQGGFCRALLCQRLVVQNVTCLASYYLCFVLKSGTLINYYSKVLIKHQSKAGLLGWGLL